MVLSAACGRFVDPEDYDRSCETADECVIVLTGDLCGPPSCQCGNDAIAVQDLERYRQDAAEGVCPPDLSLRFVECLCSSVDPICTDGAWVQLTC